MWIDDDDDDDDDDDEKSVLNVFITGVNKFMFVVYI